jgi:hypothetical protein
MTISLTQGATILYPEIVTGYDTTRKSSSTLHKVIGRGDPDVTLGSISTRSGTLEIWCSSYLVALDVEGLHTRTGVVVLADTLAPGKDMSYVVDGEVRVSPEMGTSRWLVSIAYAEVLP